MTRHNIRHNLVEIFETNEVRCEDCGITVEPPLMTIADHEGEYCVPNILAAHEMLWKLTHREA